MGWGETNLYDGHSKMRPQAAEHCPSRARNPVRVHDLSPGLRRAHLFFSGRFACLVTYLSCSPLYPCNL
jgi:hypothetical protein